MPSSEASKSSRAKFLETGIFVLCLLVYAGTMSFPFVYDDIGQLVDNPSIRSWRFLPQFFGSHMWAGVLADSGYYRPLVLIWFRLNDWLFGLKPAGWHFTSILLHAVAALLVFRLVHRLFRNRASAALASLIFGLHPIHVQSVAWVSGITDPLLAIFLMGSFLGYLSFRDTGRSIHLVGSLLLYAFATLTKEPGIVLPAMVFAHECIRPKHTTPATRLARFKSATLAALPFMAVTLAYLAARARALHGLAPRLSQMDMLTMLLTLPSVLWLDVKHLFLPWGYSLYYDCNAVERVFDSQFLVPTGLLILLLLALGVISYRFRVPRDTILIGGLWFLVPLLPSLYLPAIQTAIFGQDRYLYISCIGFAMVLSDLLLRALRHLDRQERQTAFAFYAGAVLAIGLASCTLIQQQYWESNLALYSRAVTVAPNNEQALGNLAVALAEHRPADSIAIFERCLSKDPNSAKLNYLYGYTLYRIGRYSPSLLPLARAAQLDPTMADAFLYIGMSHLRLGYPRYAEVEIRHAIVLEPNKRRAHLALGDVYEAEGNLPAALRETEIEARNYPDDYLVRRRLDALQQHPTN